MGRPNILYTAFVAQDFFTGPIAGMRGSLRKLAMGTDAVSGKLNSSFLGLTNTMMGAAAAGAAIIIPLGLATKAAIDFEKEMGNVSTIVDTTSEHMGDMGQNVLRIARQIPKPIHELTESLYQIRSAGTSAADAMKTLMESGKLAVAGLGTVQESANMITSAVTVFKKEGIDAATASDVLFKTVAGGKTKVALLAESFGKAALAASDVGISFRELMAMTAAMTNTGVQTSEAQTSITQAMISLNKRTGEMVEIQEKLSGKLGITGMEFLQWAGSGVAAMKMIDEYANKNHQDIFKIYGRKEGALADIALTRLQNKKYEELYATMKDGNTINAAFAKQSETGAAQIALFKTRVTTLGISLGNILIPALNKTLGILEPIIDATAYLVTNNKSLIKTIALTAVTLKLVRLGMITYNAVLGITAVMTTDVTAKERLFNMQLAATPGYARGAAVGLGVMNGSAKALLLTLGRIAIIAVPIYALMKAMDEHDKKRAKMDVVLAHLPEGTDREKMKKTPLDYYMNAGSLGADSTTKAYMKMYEDIGKKYYDDPRAIQDSIMEKISNPYQIDSTIINGGANMGGNTKGKTSFNTPSVGSPFSAGSNVPSAGASDGPGNKYKGGEYTFTFVNETGFNMNVDKRGDAATPVNIVVKSTTSRNKKLVTT